MNEETSIELSIADRINQLHEKAESIAKLAKEKANEAIAYALECGKLLTEQKKNIGHGKWEEWQGKNCKFSQPTACRYIRLYRKFTEALPDSNLSHVTDLENAPLKTLRQAYIATGILPEAEKADDSDKRTSQCDFVRWIDKLVIWYNKRTENDPLEDWEPQTRKLLINELRPWVKIYNDLIDLNEDA